MNPKETRAIVAKIKEYMKKNFEEYSCNWASCTKDHVIESYLVTKGNVTQSIIIIHKRGAITTSVYDYTGSI